MTFDAHKDFAYSTVLSAPSPASSGTSLVVQSGDGAKFPATSFNATVWPVAAQPTTTNAEIVRVTGISTDTFTITRAQESSSARTIVVGDQIAATVTNKTLTDIENVLLGTTTQAQLDDALVKGNIFNSQNATDQNTVLTASTNFTYDNLLEIGTSNTLEIPATSTLEIESYIDQPYFNNMLRTAPNASNTFISQSATTQNITLPASTDFIAVGLFEIGAGNNLEIPSTSTLAIEPTPAANFAAGANQAAVLTSEASALQTYGDNLTTVGPSVTVNIGPLGIVLVVLYAYALNNGVNGETFTSFVVSGANTQAAADNYAMFYQAYANNAETQAGTTFLLTGLLPGSTTFKMQYRVTANTGTWKNRRIAVVPLG